VKLQILQYILITYLKQ